MKDEAKNRAYNMLVVAVILVICAGGLMKAWPAWKQYRMLQSQIAEREEKIADLTRATAEFNDKQRRFQSDTEFVESIARQNNRVYPGELVFLFEGRR